MSLTNDHPYMKTFNREIKIKVITVFQDNFINKINERAQNNKKQTLEMM